MKSNQAISAGDQTQRGISLIEMMAATAMLVVITGGIFSSLNRAQRVFTAEQANIDAQQNTRFAILRLAEIIRGAGNNPAGISTINAVSGVEITGGAQDADGNITGGTAIELRSDLNGNRQFTDTITGNNDVVISSEDVTITLSGNQVLLKDNNTPGSQPIPIAEDIKAMSFDFTRDQKLVTVHITGKSSRPLQDGSFRESELNGKVRLRNR